jgi:hypothetical protein
MELDKKMLESLLAMNDRQLGELIEKIAAESGIDPARLCLNPDQIQKIRQVLASATDADLQRLTAVYRAYRQNGKQS